MEHNTPEGQVDARLGNSLRFGDLMPPEALEEGIPDDPVVHEEPVAEQAAQPALPDPLPPGMIARAQFTSEVIDREPSDQLATSNMFILKIVTQEANLTFTCSRPDKQPLIMQHPKS